MGRRSRKRASSPIAPPVVREDVAPAPAPAAPRTATYKSRREDAPKLGRYIEKSGYAFDRAAEILVEDRRPAFAA